jgi:hypothetical protein
VCRLPFRDDLVGNATLPAIHGGVGAFRARRSSV